MQRLASGLAVECLTVTHIENEIASVDGSSESTSNVGRRMAAPCRLDACCLGLLLEEGRVVGRLWQVGVGRLVNEPAQSRQGVRKST